jgi:hypothetical protein
MAWWEQAECINEAFKKVMTSADANFVGRSTQKGLSSTNLPQLGEAHGPAPPIFVVNRNFYDPPTR